MSTRAIAAATRVGVATVHRELASGVPIGTPASTGLPTAITGTDGKSYSPSNPLGESRRQS